MKNPILPVMSLMIVVLAAAIMYLLMRIKKQDQILSQIREEQQHSSIDQTDVLGAIQRYTDPIVQQVRHLSLLEQQRASPPVIPRTPASIPKPRAEQQLPSHNFPVPGMPMIIELPFPKFPDSLADLLNVIDAENSDPSTHSSIVIEEESEAQSAQSAHSVESVDSGDLVHLPPPHPSHIDSEKSPTSRDTKEDPKRAKSQKPKVLKTAAKS